MQFADDTAKTVFRAYSFPCLELRVLHKEISKAEVHDLIHGYPLHRLGENLEGKYFPRAVAHCSETARRTGKEMIDAEAIRQYFWYEHEKYVEAEWNAGIMKNPDHCVVWPGVVLGINGDMRALVTTPFECKERRTELVGSMKSGDYVMIHRGFVSEIIDKETHDRVLRVKRLINRVTPQ